MSTTWLVATPIFVAVHCAEHFAVCPMPQAPVSWPFSREKDARRLESDTLEYSGVQEI